MRDCVRVALCGLVTEFCPDGAASLLADVSEHEERLRRVYGALPVWPADAQFAVHVMAWIVGPGWSGFRSLRVIDRLLPDFRAAAELAQIPNRGHSGVIAINDRVSRSFRNAQVVVTAKLNPDRLYYPAGLG